MKDSGGGLGTTIGDAGFDLGFVVVVLVVLAFVVAFDFPRVVGVLWVGAGVLVDVDFDLVLVFGVDDGPVV